MLGIATSRRWLTSSLGPVSMGKESSVQCGLIVEVEAAMVEGVGWLSTLKVKLFRVKLFYSVLMDRHALAIFEIMLFLA